MYLHSYPGTGKKIFGASLYRSQGWLNRGFVGYYSFSAGDMQRTTTTSLLGSLIHQILSSNPLNFDTVRDLYKAIEKRSIWNRHILWAMLESLLSSLAHITALHCKWSSQLISPREQYLPQLFNYLNSDSVSTPVKFIFIRELQQNLRSLFQSYSVLELDTHTLCSRLVQIQTDLLLTKLHNEKPFLMSQALKASLEEKLLACQNLTQLSITVEVIEQGIRNDLTYIKPGEFGLEVGTNLVCWRQQ